MPFELRYRKGDKIGGRYLVHQAMTGGMGEVYLCLDLQENEPYALKTFQARFLTNLNARKYFEREAATWVALEEHPNIVRCFYMTPFDYTPFLFLEWVAGAEGVGGPDLRDWLNRRGPIEPRHALKFTLDVCRGLEHAQRKVPGLVHCDIKPENVLVAQGQVAKLTDFGLTKIVRDAGLLLLDPAVSIDRPQWQVSSAGGTPPYMAPEQWRSETVDARTDVYSVGCLLYELLTGRSPFQATTLEGLKWEHLEASPPPLPRAIPGLRADELDPLLAKCLAKDPGNRYSSASELIEAIASLFEMRNWESPRAVTPVGEFTAVDYSNRGITYRALGRHAQALCEYDAAIRVDPNLVLAYCNRGGTYYDLGRYEEALADFDAAIRIAPDYVAAYTNRGLTHAAHGRRADALADYDSAVRLDPRDARILSNRGQTHNAMGRYAEAIADYDAALQIDPNLAQAYCNRGMTYYHLGRFADALADLDTALRIDPTDAKYYNDRGAVYHALDRHAEAIADEHSAIRIDPNHASAYAILGNTYKALGRLSEALTAFDAAIRLKPNFAAAYAWRAVAYDALGRGADALAGFNEAIQIDPSDASAYLNKGVLHTKREEWRDALEAYDNAARLGNQMGAQYAAELREAMGIQPAPTLADAAQAAFEAFIDVDDPDQLREVVDRHPILRMPEFPPALEKVLVGRVHPDDWPAVRQRFDWLRQLTNPKPGA